MKNRVAFSWLVLIFSGLLILLCFPSCKKDNGPAEAVITVLDKTSGNPIVAGTVVLHQDTAINKVTGVQASIKDTKTTDATGKTFHSFQYEALLYIDVTFAPGRSATDYIRLERGKTVSKTILLP